MRIAFVSLMKILPWGGSEDLWYRTAKLALSNGYYVISLTQKWSSVPDKLVELKKLGVDTHFYYTAHYPTLVDRVATKLRVKKRVEEIIPAINADIYIVSNGSVFDFVYNKHIIKSIIDSGKPYIMISQHNFESGNILSGSQRDYAINIIKSSLKVFFVSKRNLQNAERQIAYKIRNAEIISNPLNISNLLIKPFPRSSSLLMACVARLDCGFKGQDVLLEVLGKEFWINRDFVLRLYGSGPHLEHLQYLIKFYGLQNKVFIEGHVNNVDQIWNDNQVLILPSLSEGTPLALVEAMLSGRAAVATDVGDNSEYVKDGNTGFLAPTASINCMTAALEKLWRNKASLQTMGENAFEHAQGITDLHPDKTMLNFINKIE